MNSGLSPSLRAGVVGTGFVGVVHVHALRLLGIDVAGVVGSSPERAAAKGLAPVYDSLEALLADPSVAVVHLTTPNHLHHPQVKQVLEAGKHVVCEKPMAISLEDADALVKECDAAGVQLFVVKQNRLNPAIQLLKRAVDRGRFGRIYLANTTVRWTRPQEYYDQAPWRGTWEFDGGAIMNQASHYVDLIQWLVGPVESVMAKTATLARRIESEDTGIAVLKFRSGALGVIEVTMLTYPRNLEGSITILGEKGSVKVGGTAVNRVEHWSFADYDDDDKLVESVATNPPSVYGFGHEGYYRNVLAVLRGEAKAETDGRAGRKSLELILGIYESAKTGRDVPIPLTTRTTLVSS